MDVTHSFSDEDSSTLDGSNSIYQNYWNTLSVNQESNGNKSLNEYDPNLDQRYYNSLFDKENSSGNSGIDHILKDIPVIDYSKMMPQPSMLDIDNKTNYLASTSNPKRFSNILPNNDCILNITGASTDRLERNSATITSNEYPNEVFQIQGNNVVLPQNWPTTSETPPGSYNIEAASRHNTKNISSISVANFKAPPLIFRTWEGEKFYLPAPADMMVSSQIHPPVSNAILQQSKGDLTLNQILNNSSTRTHSADDMEERTIYQVPLLERLLVPSQNHPPTSLKNSQRSSCTHLQTSNLPPELEIQNTGQNSTQREVPSSVIHFSRSLVATYIMFLHAHECDQPICSSVEGIPSYKVDSLCILAKKVLDHIDNCKEESRCQLTDCKRFKKFQNHFKVCVDSHCSVCRYLKIHFDLSRQIRVCVRNDCSFCWTLIQLNENSRESLAHPMSLSPSHLSQESTSAVPDRRHSIDTSTNSSTSLRSFHSDAQEQEESTPLNSPTPSRRHSVSSSSSSDIIYPMAPSPVYLSESSSSSVPDRRHSIDALSISPTSSGSLCSDHQPQQVSTSMKDDNSPRSSRRHSVGSSSSSEITGDQIDTEAQLTLLVHSVKCRKLNGECNKPGCGERKKALLHLLTCRKGKICSDGNCQRDFFHSLLTRHRQTCFTGCSHCNFFKGRLGNHPFHINEDSFQQHNPQNIEGTDTDQSLEENIARSTLKHLAASSSSSTNINPPCQPASHNDELPSISRKGNNSLSSSTLISQPVREEEHVESNHSPMNVTASTSLENIATSHVQGQHAAGTSRISLDITPTDQSRLQTAQLPRIINRVYAPERTTSSFNRELIPSCVRTSESVIQLVNSTANFNTSTSNLGRPVTSSGEEQLVAGQSRSFSNVTSPGNLNEFEEKVSLVLHAMVCKNAEEQCSILYCTEAKHLVRHFVSCENERNCDRCKQSQELFRSIQVRHWKICRQRSNCNCCKFFNGRLGNPYNRVRWPNHSIHDNTASPYSSTVTRHFTDSGRTASQQNEVYEDRLRLGKRIKLEESTDKLKKQDKPKESEDDLCKICMDAPLNTVFLECGHIVACVTCGERTKNCPICRQIIRRIVRTFKA